MLANLSSQVISFMGGASTAFTILAIYSIAKVIWNYFKLKIKILKFAIKYSNAVGLLIYKKLQKISDKKLRDEFIYIGDKCGDAFNVGLDAGLKGIKIKDFNNSINEILKK